MDWQIPQIEVFLRFHRLACLGARPHVASLKTAHSRSSLQLWNTRNIGINSCNRDSLCCRGSWPSAPVRASRILYMPILRVSIDLSSFEIIWKVRFQASRAELALRRLEPERVTLGASTSN